MERIGNRRIENFPPTTLFLDDLRDILAILGNACDRIEVKAGDYKITGPSELDALASKFPSGRFDSISLQGYTPYVSIDLYGWGVSAYISEDTVEQRGIIAQIADVIARGKKIDPTWLYQGLLYTVTSIGTVLVTLTFLGILHPPTPYVIGATLLVLSFLSVPLIVPYTIRRKVIVHSKARGATESFLKRKKDDLGLAAISATLGAIITYLITKYLP